jgi:RNA-directed DNA polymerase
VRNSNLGFTFRYDRDRYGGTHRYLNVTASKKALARERAVLRSMTDKTRCFEPLPDLVGRLNRHLRGWANYFGHGYPRAAFRQINAYVRLRLSRHLRRRSQRAFRPPEGATLYAHFDRLGLVYL